MTTIKNVTEEKEKKLKSLTEFFSDNKTENYNRGGKSKSKSKNPKESTEQVKK